MDNFNQQLFYVLTRARNVSDQQQRSKGASMTLSMKEWADRQRTRCPMRKDYQDYS